MAKKRKFPKKPGKPKLSASPSTWVRFDERMKDWEKKCNEIKADQKKKETIIKKWR